jgi:putative phage-type endonuclease
VALSNPLPRTVEESTAHHTFLEERMSCVGGSDAQHVLQLPPYGCQRRLFYEKLGVVADFPFDGNHHTRRGILLEPIAAGEYEHHTGRLVHPGGFVRHPQYRYLGVHLDRRQECEGQDGLGALELKVPALRTWLKMRREGPPAAYVAQVQHGMFIAGLKWGTVAAWNPDAMRTLYWDFPRDEAMQLQILTGAAQLWRLVQDQLRGMEVLDAWVFGGDPPDPPGLDAGAKACLSCPFRRRCRGLDNVEPTAEERDELARGELATDAELDLLAAQRAELKAQEKELGDAIDDVEGKIKAKLDAAGKGLRGTAGALAYWQTYVRETKPQPAKRSTVKRLRVITPEKEDL